MTDKDTLMIAYGILTDLQTLAPYGFKLTDEEQQTIAAAKGAAPGRTIRGSWPTQWICSVPRASRSRKQTSDNELQEFYELSIMKQAEREQLQAVLDKFDRREDECYDKMGYMEEHKFNYEKQAIDLKRQAYHECFRELQATLSRMKVDEWTQQDEAIAKEIITFFRDGTVKLQHDLNLYATWLEKWVAKQK